jgi:hypothetical protein
MLGPMDLKIYSLERNLRNHPRLGKLTKSQHFRQSYLCDFYFCIQSISLFIIKHQKTCIAAFIVVSRDFLILFYPKIETEKIVTT